MDVVWRGRRRTEDAVLSPAKERGKDGLATGTLSRALVAFLFLLRLRPRLFNVAPSSSSSFYPDASRSLAIPSFLTPYNAMKAAIVASALATVVLAQTVRLRNLRRAGETALRQLVGLWAFFPSVRVRCFIQRYCTAGMWWRDWTAHHLPA